MENSPLRFLDYDMSLMLADQVKISQEEESRRFHLNMWTASRTLDTRVLKGTIHRVFNGIKRYWGDFWDEELSGKTTMHPASSTNRRIILYEQELKNIMDGRKYLKPSEYLVLEY